MKRYYVIGSNSSNSLSPLIFNHWFKKYNIKAVYSFIEVGKPNFDKTLINIIQNKISRGLNITTPYKKNIIKHLHSISRHAENIGAVNCVTLGKNIKGTNTDWKGYLSSIKLEKIGKNKNILILGYGGASQAIYYGLSVKGHNNIVVFNRSKKAIRLNNVNRYTKKYSLIDNYLMDADLIINTTPTNPLSKKQTNLVKKETLISDIVYKPKKTKFLKSFEENKKIYGITMLIEQAIPCFRLWFGFVPKIDDSLVKKLNKKIK